MPDNDDPDIPDWTNDSFDDTNLISDDELAAIVDPVVDGTQTSTRDDDAGWAVEAAPGRPTTPARR